MRKITNRILAILVIFCVLLSFVSCNKDNNGEYSQRDINNGFSGIASNEEDNPDIIDEGEETEYDVSPLTFCIDDESDFSIIFFDVGEGDSALVSCEGHHMLIDGGPKGSGDKVYNTLVDNKISELDYLVISHMHQDHIGGLPRALEYIYKVKKTLSVTTEIPVELYSELIITGCLEITVPKDGKKYPLGSAEIEVIAVGDPTENENDSLVILVSYGSTSFLFTGDIEGNMIHKISDKYSDKLSPVTLVKVPHHGAKDSTEYGFYDVVTNPKYAVISVGKNNRNRHPSEEVLDILSGLKTEVYRTDYDGDIMVESDGSHISIKTEK